MRVYVSFITAGFGRGILLLPAWGGDMARYEELNRRLEKHQASISTGGQHLGTYGTSKRDNCEGLMSQDELRWVAMLG